jgi:hypothetical protein
VNFQISTARERRVVRNPLEEYASAAREGVNNKKERLSQAKYVRMMMDEVLG